MASEEDSKQSGSARNGSSAYYDKGSSELAEDTPLTLRRLETVRQQHSFTFRLKCSNQAQW